VFNPTETKKNGPARMPAVTPARRRFVFAGWVVLPDTAQSYCDTDTSSVNARTATQLEPAPKRDLASSPWEVSNRVAGQANSVDCCTSQPLGPPRLATARFEPLHITSMHLADQARNTFRTDFTRHERPAMNNNGSHGYRATRLCGKRDHAELPAPHDYSRATVVVDGSRSAERAKATSDASARAQRSPLRPLAPEFQRV